MLPAGVRRLFRLGRAGDVEREVDAELAFHFEEKTRALIASGLSPEAAAEEARRQFGDVRQVRADLVRTDERVDVRSARAEWWDGCWQDFRYALRGLRRTPAMAVAVVVMLGLGIGGAAAMYGLLDRLLLSVGPHVERPDELHRIYVNEYDAYFTRSRVFRASFFEPQVRGFAAALPGRPALAVTATWRDRLGGPRGPRTPIALASGNAFQVLGTRPLIGRLLEPADDDAAAPPAAVISHGLWRRAFGGSDSALGQTLALGRTRYTIVGVAPAGFSGLRPGRVDAWVPMQIGGAAHYGPQWREGAGLFEVVLRLPPGTDPTPLAAAATLSYREMGGRRSTDSVARALLASVLPAKRPDGLSATARLSLIVGGVAAMLCCIAVANATILLLLRGMNRRRETAVRLALGVGRLRLLRGVLLESMLLALGGAVAAGVVANRGAELLQKLIVRTEWQQGVAAPGVLAFAGLLSLLIGLITGLVPGWQASRPDAVAALRAGARTAAGRSRLRTGLLALQAALTVVLVAGLALYVRSFLKARGVDYVVDADRLISINVRASEESAVAPGWYAASTADLAQRLRALPGVEAVSEASIAPLFGYSGAVLRAEGVDSLRMDNRGPFITEIDAEFLRVTGLRLMRGRAFTAAEVATHAPVALVNDAMAERLWSGQEPLGKCLYVGSRSEPGAAVCRQVVGVVTSYRNQLQEERRMENYYLPLGYRWSLGARGGHTVIVRAGGAPATLLPSILGIVRQAMSDANPDDVRWLGELLERDIAPWRAGTTLFALFAGLAVLLAMGGLYSVVAFSVAQRRQEFGIRVAVGATARHLARLVFSSALRPVATGLVAGLGLALWLGRFLGPLLFELSPRDPLALAGAVACLLMAAMLACIPPTRAAVRADPREALQAE